MFREGLIPFTQNLKTSVEILDQIGLWAENNCIVDEEMDVIFETIRGKIKIIVCFAPLTINIKDINGIREHIEANFGKFFEIDERIQMNRTSTEFRHPYAYAHDSDYFRIVLVTSNCIV